MSPFEQQFILDCLENIKRILNDKEALNNAVRSFTNDDLQNPRYLLTTKITDAIFWDISAVCEFSAAYSEALFQVTTSYAAKENHELHSARELLETYIKEVTNNTKTNQRIQSVIENCDTQINTLKQKEDNPYGFFSSKRSTALLISATVAAGAMAVLLARS